MHIGLTEIIVIILVAVCIISPMQAQSFARKLGGHVRAFKEAVKDVTDVKESVVEEKQELDDIVKL
jgi:Sec-independent protein translocase protein TatA